MIKPAAIYAVIVLYNKSFHDSITFNSISKHKSIQIIICDNSTSDFYNEQSNSFDNVTYINMKGNKGLPKAYNQALDYIGNQTGIICWFDDDTAIPDEYFDLVIHYFLTPDLDIALPVVFDEVGMLSPCILKGNYCHRAKNLAEIAGNISAINSGLSVNLKVYEDFRYDDNMFLDFVDHAFFREMRRRHKTIQVMQDNILYQKFAANSSSKESAIVRFKILKKDLRYFYKDTTFSRLYYHYIIMRRKARLVLKYRSLKMAFI
ncbi:glycosyltransferase [Oscillospiraceae bacterium HV4-5-C5C]|nr:glycosyltransferase [Oscillospiraceae bacterium HV4-5-C5C]